jgi:hypothetical protein
VDVLCRGDVLLVDVLCQGRGVVLRGVVLFLGVVLRGVVLCQVCPWVKVPCRIGSLLFVDGGRRLLARLLRLRQCGVVLSLGVVLRVVVLCHGVVLRVVVLCQVCPWVKVPCRIGSVLFVDGGRRLLERLLRLRLVRQRRIWFAKVRRRRRRRRQFGEKGFVLILSCNLGFAFPNIEKSKEDSRAHYAYKIWHLHEQTDIISQSVSQWI